MLSEQMMYILKLCQEHGVKLSHNEIAIMCNLNKEFVEEIFKIFSDCEPKNEKAFLELLKQEEFIMNRDCLKILDIISDLNSNYIDELMTILNRPEITKIPTFLDYLNIYYYVTTKPDYLKKYELKSAIISFIEKASAIYREHNNINELKIGIKEELLKKIDEEYDYFILNKDVIYFEDGADDFTDDLNDFFEYKSKSRSIDVHKLIRAIKPKNIPKKNNIVKVDFKQEN